MKTAIKTPPLERSSAYKALEDDFPIVEISRVAEQESWRKEVNRPIYHIHKWWAKRLGTVFRALTLGAFIDGKKSIWSEFYKTHDFSDKVVLDPFMGSGTTLGEALKLGAKVVGCDVNPVSTFAVRQALTRVPESDLRAAFEVLENSVAAEIRKYYQTVDPETGEEIPVLYYFWVKLVTTPDGEEIPIFDHYVFAKDAYPKKKPKAQIICPSCWDVIEDRYDATELECPGCSHTFNPQKGPAKGQTVISSKGESFRIKELIQKSGKAPAHKLYAMLAVRENGEKIYLRPTERDFALFDEAETRLEKEDIPLPAMGVRPGHNTNQALGYNYFKWREFFNDRQLLCLGILLKEILKISDEAIQEQFICLFSSTLEFNNLFCSYKGEGTGAVRHMFSNHILKPERKPLENSVWGHQKSSGTFRSLFESRLIRAKKYLDEPFEIDFEKGLLGDKLRSKKTLASRPIDVSIVSTWSDLKNTQKAAMILNGDSSKLPVPDCSVDAVITDPPYFDFVHYSELSDFFFAWLSPALKERYPWLSRPDSSDKGEVQHKDPAVFAHQLSLVLSESCRVLKAGGVLAFSFHHSREEGWAAIYEAISRAGLEVVEAHPLHAELRSASPKSAAKDPISLDAILVCRKIGESSAKFLSFEEVLSSSRSFSDRLEAGGISLSKSDQFVIAASRAMIGATSHGLSYSDYEDRIGRMREAMNHEKVALHDSSKR